MRVVWAFGAEAAILGLFQKQMEACHIRGLFWFRVEIAKGSTTICGQGCGSGLGFTRVGLGGPTKIKH